MAVPERDEKDFRGEQTDEPSVIGWMPSAQLYFRDPDGHSVEFIALLDDTQIRALLDHCPSGAKDLTRLDEKAESA